MSHHIKTPSCHVMSCHHNTPSHILPPPLPPLLTRSTGPSSVSTTMALSKYLYSGGNTTQGGNITQGGYVNQGGNINQGAAGTGYSLGAGTVGGSRTSKSLFLVTNTTTSQPINIGSSSGGRGGGSGGGGAISSDRMLSSSSPIPLPQQQQQQQQQARPSTVTWNLTNNTNYPSSSNTPPSHNSTGAGASLAPVSTGARASHSHTFTPVSRLNKLGLNLQGFTI